MPEPECLAKEKVKESGKYNCGDVLPRLSADFKNKCYICECKEPTSINIEHFIPHKGNKELKFSWNNLFFACSHCNNTKLDKYDNILNCTNANDKVDKNLKYCVNPINCDKVEIENLGNDDRAEATRNLLMEVYNGTTELKKLESANLRKLLLANIRSFNQLIFEYFKISEANVKSKKYLTSKIKYELSNASHFTAFKRWIIWNSDKLNNEFGHLI